MHIKHTVIHDILIARGLLFGEAVSLEGGGGAREGVGGGGGGGDLEGVGRAEVG